jgi:hypothetical protein
MNKPFYNPENIEAYITNKMPAADKISFQNELAKDPLLNNEIDLQKDIIAALKQQRKAELKTRLNKIQIDTTTNYAGLKVAASILLAGLISFGTYNYISSQKNNRNTISSNNTVAGSSEKTITTNSGESNNNVITENKTSKAASTNSNDIKGTVIAKNELNDNASSTIATKAITRNKTAESGDPVANAPEIKDRYDESDGIKTDNDIKMPKGDFSNTNDESSLDNLKIETIKDKNHNLFYQYYNNKLFLYGDFDSKPYEILELNTIKDKQLYLYFENNYYGLHSNQTEITPLSVIKDKGTLSNLELIRNK